jgi:hypothetical protein
MSTTDVKAVARRFIEEVLGKGRFDMMGELAAPHYLDHNLPPGVTPQQSIGAVRAGFPDLRVTIDDRIAEGDKVVTRWTIHGTHTGNLFGMPPTGQAMTMTGISIYRIAEGKMVEGWVQYDQLGMMQQLGLAPVPGH